MSWFVSFCVGLLTAAAGTLAGGYIASLCVDWYHVSSREGGAGYFVVAMALLALLAGLVVGLVVTRVVAAQPDPWFLKALGIALGLHLGLIAAIGGVARLLADVPPEIDGQMLLLVVELRYPPEQQASPAGDAEEGYIQLHSIPAFSHTVRASERGALWKEDARQVEGRWVVPGAVNVFTSRGKRVLSVTLQGDSSQGFLVPLRGYPGGKDLEWSEWLPREGRGGPPRATGFNYRYKVQRWSVPVRSQMVGRFEVQSMASHFWAETVDEKTTTVASAGFRVRLGGEPVVIESATAAEPYDADQVAVIPGADPALLVHSEQNSGSGSCYLVVVDGAAARVDSLPGCAGLAQGERLTADLERFRAGDSVKPVRGRIDRLSFQEPGLYLIGNAVLDSRTITLHRFTPDSEEIAIPSVAPLTISPDERSFVRFAYGRDAGGLSSEDLPVLIVTDFRASRSYTLPIDAARMRFADFHALDPAWVEHHFAWERGPDGADRLAERKHFTPIPYRGKVSVETGGDRSYRIEKGSEALRGALIEFLVAEFKGEPQPADSDAYEKPVTVDGKVVNVAHSGDFGYVLVSLARGSGDTTLVPAIATKFDAALATGKYDAMFGK